MRKYYLMIIALLICNNLSAEDLKIQFVFKDGSNFELLNSEIKKFDFTKLNKNCAIQLFTKSKGIKEYETIDVKYLNFGELSINYEIFNIQDELKYSELDSMKFIESSNLESPVNKYERELFHRWIDEVIKLGQVSVGFSPPVTARAYGYTALALYETLLPAMPNNVSMAGQIEDWQGLTTKPNPNINYHWGLVMNSVMAEMCLLIPGESNRPVWKQEVIDLEASFNEKYKSECTTEEYEASIAYGKECAKEVYAFSKTDPIYETITTEPKEPHNSNFPTSYEPPVGPGKWVPSPPLLAPALQPYWGQCRPFLKKNRDEVLPEPPIEYSADSNSRFYNAMNEVNEVAKNLTPEQRIIALYWDDAPFKTQTPGGHSIKIYNQLMKENRFSISRAVESFLKVSMSIHDAFVNCWKVKYTHNEIRPINYIREFINPNFNAVFATPPFPDYTSGHSTQSGAAFTIFVNTFGNRYTFTDSSHVNRSDINEVTRAPRTYNSLNDMFDEVSMSRLYGGIHHRFSLEEGIRVGKLIGQNIWDLKYRK